MAKKYRISKEGTEVGVMTGKQACRYLCITQPTLQKYADSEEMYKGIYDIVEEDQGQCKSSENLKTTVLADWDAVRFKLNPKAKGWEKYFGHKTDGETE